MSERIGNISIIEAEDDDVCQLCGKVAECRPYGPNGERICYECGMKNVDKTNEMIGKVLFGETKPQ